MCAGVVKNPLLRLSPFGGYCIRSLNFTILRRLRIRKTRSANAAVFQVELSELYKIPQFHNPSQAQDGEIIGMTIRFWVNRGNEGARLRNFFN